MRMDALIKSRTSRAQQQEIRPRRNSKDYENFDLTPEGRLLVNAGKPIEDPDVFVAEHLTHVLKPHQLGGVRFM